MLAKDNPALVAIRTRRGLAAKLARKLNISPSAVWMWKRVPPVHAVKVARAIRMPVHLVCPEMYPAPNGARKPRSSVANVK